MSAYPARLKSTRRFVRMFPWLSGLVLVAGIVAVVIVLAFRDSSSNESAAPVTPAKPAVVNPTPKQVPVPRAARIVAGRFILTAVQRKNLAQAWTLVGPQIRQGMTRKQWLTGNIAVVPWFGQLDQVPMKVDYSYRNEVQLTVILAPKKGTKGKPDTFIINLNRFGKRWLVTSWVPYEPAAVRANPSN